MTNIWKIVWSVRTKESQSQSNLTDADNDIEELTEEEAKGVFVELVVDMLTVIGHQLPKWNLKVWTLCFVSKIVYFPCCEDDKQNKAKCSNFLKRPFLAAKTQLNKS